jgi:hypothetical protein
VCRTHLVGNEREHRGFFVACVHERKSIVKIASIEQVRFPNRSMQRQVSHTHSSQEVKCKISIPPKVSRSNNTALVCIQHDRKSTKANPTCHTSCQKQIGSRPEEEDGKVKDDVTH